MRFLVRSHYWRQLSEVTDRVCDTPRHKGLHISHSFLILFRMAHLLKIAKPVLGRKPYCNIKYAHVEHLGSSTLLSTQRFVSILLPGRTQALDTNNLARTFANKAKGEGYQGTNKSKEELEMDESRQYSASNAQVDKKGADSYPEKLKSSHKVSANEENNTDTESSDTGKSRTAKSKEKESSLPTYS